jgi:hypothetical protein
MMSWEWSHSPEAYANARENLAKLDKVTLRTIYAEIEAAQKDDDGNYKTSSTTLDSTKFNFQYMESRQLSKAVLVDRIWDFMEEFRTCDNGGHLAWCCPYGCDAHKVSFEEE